MRRGFSNGAVILAVLWGVVVIDRQVCAQERDPRELEAKKACLAGRTIQGIELLAALYAETNDATYIFNQGRCFEQNGKAQDAITRFREYLRKASTITPEEKAQVQRHISEMEDQARQNPAPTVVSPESPPGIVQSQPDPSLQAATTATTAATSPTSDSSPRTSGTAHAFRIASITAAAVGVIAVAGGIYMGLQARSLSDEITMEANNGTFSRDKFNEGQRSETLQWVGYGVGAAGLATGGLLFYLGTRSSAVGGTRLTAIPSLGRDGATVLLRAMF